MVGLSTAGNPTLSRAPGRSARSLQQTVVGYGMPRRRASSKVRSLLFAAARESAEGKANLVASASSWGRHPISAAIDPSLPGSTTRVG
jgi:hypothetical protein